MALHATQQDVATGNEVAPDKSAPAPRNFLRTTLACIRVPVLVLLFCIAAGIECKYQTALADSDIWIYLRTGAWILQNHALPHSSLFTQYSGRPWIAYSWGFDVLASALYNLLGLRALPIMLVCFKVGLAIALFRLAGGSRQNFWPAVLLCAAGQYTIPDLEARPGFLSILFLAIELLLLFKSRRSGNVRPLYWLPVLFACWANTHIQFFNGLFVLLLFLAGILLEQLGRDFKWQWLSGEEIALPLKSVAIVTSLCFLATLLSPYTYHLYAIAWQYAHSKAAYSYIPEMHAMNFREPQHYARLLLAMGAFFCLGRRRSCDLFQFALLIAGVIIAFHARRDSWLLVLSSIAVIANAYSNASGKEVEKSPGHSWHWQMALASALTLIVLVATVTHYIPANREALLGKVGENYPVRACDFIRENQLPQPLFNPLTWGGFMMWYLPDYPVSSDGRVDLYGDDIIIRQYEVLDSERSPAEEPTFTGARTLLLKSYSPLAWNLSRSPQYRLVYRDTMASVFLRTQQ